MTRQTHRDPVSGHHARLGRRDEPVAVILRPMRQPSDPNAAAAATSAALDLAALSEPHLSPVLGRYFERSWSHGEGHRLYDTAGRAYLDFANGIAVTALGHRHPAVTAAIHAQVDRLIGPTGAIGFAEPVARLVGRLAATLPEPIDSVFLLNSGSEAIDAALKLARRVTGRPGIVAFQGAFHGRTYGAASITSSSLNYRRGYEPFLPGVHLVPYPAAWRDHDGDEDRATDASMAALHGLFSAVIPASEVAAIVIEPVIGEGGYIPAPTRFLRELRALCEGQGILLVADEVQTGYGRTGRMWAFEHAGIVPDVVCIAKAIANGLPLSAVATRRDLQERWGKGAHGSTYGGNPVACAAALAVLDTIEGQSLIANAAARGAELTDGLGRLKAEDERIGDVRGPGLMVGVEFVRERASKAPDGEFVARLLERSADLGLLVLSCGAEHNVVRWIPPLDVTPAEISEGLELFGEALRTA
jgi:4-aminobutyrate aminotransferase